MPSPLERDMLMPLTKDVLTPQEVAEYLQLAPDTIYRYIRQGKLVASRFGRQYRIPKETVELFLLATSTAGDAQLRSFSSAQKREWIEEDQIDQGTRTTGERLLRALRDSSSS